MDVRMAELFEAALRLPEQEREALATVLLASLDGLVSEAEAMDAWREEVLRRAGEIESGAAQPIPWEEARRSIFAP